MLRPAPTLPERKELVLDQLVVHTNFRLPRQHRLMEELTALRGEVSTRLALPTSDEPIHIHLFDNADEFRSFMQSNFPTFPNRRAFFVESDTRLAVYAYWGDRVAEDLRHEVSHGYLHSVVPDLPLWLDEGLAEYFEVAPGGQGVHRPHIEALLYRYYQGQWQPDLARLERLTTLSEMRQIEYAEAWAWVYLLLHSTPEHRLVLFNYLQALRQRVPPPPISLGLRQLESNPNDALLRLLAKLTDSRQLPR